MAADPTFRMTIIDVFSIAKRGSVVTGKIEDGSLKVGDEISVRGQGPLRNVVVAGIESGRKQMDSAQAGDTVGILLRDIYKPDVQTGDLLSGEGTEFQWKP